MIKICDKTNFGMPFSPAFEKYYGNLRIGILDIETTGLNPGNSKVILGGLLTFDGDSAVKKQFFAETPSEEAALLKEYIEEVCNLDAVVTYNGKHFDLPFLIERAKHYKLTLANSFPHNLDLYLVLNGYSDLRKFLPNLKQKTVETYFGLCTNREDEISGAESVDLYFEYLNHPSAQLLDKILLHNSDDLFQLARLLPILSKADVHKAFYKLGIPVRDWSITSIKLNAKEFSVLGVQRKNAVNYRRYPQNENGLSVILDRGSSSFTIETPVSKIGSLVLFDCHSINSAFDEFKGLPYFEKDYIIIKNGDNIDYMAANHLASFLVSVAYDEACS